MTQHQEVRVPCRWTPAMVIALADVFWHDKRAGIPREVADSRVGSFVARANDKATPKLATTPMGEMRRYTAGITKHGVCEWCKTPFTSTTKAKKIPVYCSPDCAGKGRTKNFNVAILKRKCRVVKKAYDYGNLTCDTCNIVACKNSSTQVRCKVCAHTAKLARQKAYKARKKADREAGTQATNRAAFLKGVAP
jgi:hypothetical protein